MDLKYQHQTLVHVVRACNYSDADDLVAVGGEHSVEVLRVVRGIMLLFFQYTFQHELTFCF